MLLALGVWNSDTFLLSLGDVCLKSECLQSDLVIAFMIVMLSLEIEIVAPNF